MNQFLKVSSQYEVWVNQKYGHNDPLQACGQSQATNQFYFSLRKEVFRKLQNQPYPNQRHLATDKNNFDEIHSEINHPRYHLQ